MSVVNKMLQDLESRKQRAHINADYVPKANADVAGHLKPWMLAASVLVIVSAVLLSERLWLETSADNTPVQATQMQQKNLAMSSTPAVIESKALDTMGVIDASVDAGAFETAIVESEILAALPPEIAFSKTEKETQVFNSIKVKAEAASKPLHLTQAATQKVEQTFEQSKTQGKEPSEFSKSPSNGVEAQISSLRETARIALNNNDAVKAMNALEQLVENYPQDSRARKQLASLLFSHHAVEKAQKILHEGLAISPSDSALRIMLARVAFKTGDYQDAFVALTAHPYPERADIELISFRAALAERLSEYQSAQQDYQILVKREPQNAKWWLGLGVSQDKLKLGEQALAAYQQARSLNQLPTQVNTFVEQRIAVLGRRS